MSPSDAQGMPAKKRRRVMSVPDGFEIQKPAVDPPKTVIQVPKFTSAFDENTPQAQPKPLSKQKFDPRSDFAISKLATATSSNKPKSKANLKQLPIPDFRPPGKEKDKSAASVSRIQPLLDPRILIQNQSSSDRTPYLTKLSPPPPPVLPNAALSKPGVVLKNFPPPTRFVPAETNLDVSMRTISTTEIALATDLFTDSGAAELAHIFLHDQHPEISLNKETRPEWNIGMSPQKGAKYIKGKGKEVKYVVGGLAARSSELIAQSHTSLALWQKETELQLASSTSQLKPDLRLRVIKVIDLPTGARPSSPRKPSSASSTEVSTGVAICHIKSAPSHRLHLREKNYHLVVLSFPTIAPPRFRGRNGIYARNPEDFVIGREMCVWEPWHEVSLSPRRHPFPLDEFTVSDRNPGFTELTAAPFPTLPSTDPRPSFTVDESDVQISHTVILCSRFVIMP